MHSQKRPYRHMQKRAKGITGHCVPAREKSNISSRVRTFMRARDSRALNSARAGIYMHRRIEASYTALINVKGFNDPLSNMCAYIYLLYTHTYYAARYMNESWKVFTTFVSSSGHILS